MKLWNKLRGHVTEDLVAFGDGALCPERSRQVSEHLQCCKSCRGEHEEMRSVVAVLSGTLAVTPAPTGLWNAIENRWLEQTQEEVGLEWGRRLATTLRPIIGAAAVFTLLTVGAVFVWQVAPAHRRARPEPAYLQFDLGEYLRPVQAASTEDSFQAITTAAPRFAACEKREALRMAGLSSSGATPLAGYEMLAHRVSVLDQTPLAQFVYSNGQDAFCLFIAPRKVSFLFGEESAVDTEVHGIRCQKVSCPMQETYVFGEGNFHCVLVSKSLDLEEAAAIMRYFISAHKRAGRGGW